MDRHREDAGVDGGGDVRGSGGVRSDVLRDLAGVQGVDELPDGGAVRPSAGEGHGARHLLSTCSVPHAPHHIILYPVIARTIRSALS